MRRQPARRQRRLYHFDQIAAAELAGGKIDRHGQFRKPLLMPGFALKTGGAYHPGADFDDEADFFRQRNKLSRRQQSQFGMMPAQQGLHALDAPVHGIHLRLVVDDQLVAL
ncbi:hypothetical protein GALL_306820 [mine drainage metagenome]|uniref:Uncharacterized protein n=1 Tax=mine drainage metagenome TaxID=410659 RepID=A0A1J5R5W2_9ZZZZ